MAQREKSSNTKPPTESDNMVTISNKTPIKTKRAMSAVYTRVTSAATTRFSRGIQSKKRDALSDVASASDVSDRYQRLAISRQLHEGDGQSVASQHLYLPQERAMSLPLPTIVQAQEVCQQLNMGKRELILLNFHIHI